MRRTAWMLGLVALLGCTTPPPSPTPPPLPVPSPSEPEPPPTEPVFLDAIRQLSFAGRRSGEAYFRADGRQIVFQSEREPGNPFYQIYTLDLETGRARRASPGLGKTTCAYFHPDGRSLIFASTHQDPEAKAKARSEYEARQADGQRRYAWDYDEHYDLYRLDLQSQELVALAPGRGYDAEGSFSPDGRWIVFASNRQAYADGAQPAAGADVSTLVEIYRMDADGSNLIRLTDAPGYDGGPFFDAAGARVCFRRFSVDGQTAEIWTMDPAGGSARAITRLGAMSWAPYFHPSGHYLIFATSVHGHANFELYLVDDEGRHAPVRVSDTDGFDGLPVFSPDGTEIIWTSTRGGGGAQLFRARWNHQAALAALGLADDTAAPATRAVAPRRPIVGEAVAVHVRLLAGDAMEGRLTGSPGERLATAYVADVFQALGLKAAGPDGRYFQPFEATVQEHGGRRTWAGRNVLARIASGDQPTEESVVLGAHIDHLGRGIPGASRATRDQKDAIHPGADDNASGVGGLLEIARYLAAEQRAGRFRPKRDVVFAAWSGEELGLLGSAHTVRAWAGGGEDQAPLKDVIAYLNLDMIGRLKGRAIIYGVGSAPIWPALLEELILPLDLPVQLQDEGHLPTDATSFYLREVPVLSAFTGVHADYHAPTDTADKLDYDGAAAISSLLAHAAWRLAEGTERPAYIRMAPPKESGAGRGGIYLGTIPDYTQGEVRGVRLSGVSPGGPAEEAGLKGGDIIIELAGERVEDIYAFMAVMNKLKADQKTHIAVRRRGERVELGIVPRKR